MNPVSNAIISAAQSFATNPVGEQPPINKLPQELLIMILSVLARADGGEKDLVSASLVCKEWKTVTEDLLLWEIVAKRLLADPKRNPKFLRKIGFSHLQRKYEKLGLDYLFEACRFADLDAMRYIRDRAVKNQIERNIDPQLNSEIVDLQLHNEYHDLRELIELMERANYPGLLWANEAYRLAKSLLLKKGPHPAFLHKLRERGMHYLEKAANDGHTDAKVVLRQASKKEFSEKRRLLGLFWKQLAKIREGYHISAWRELSTLYERGKFDYSDKIHEMRIYYLPDKNGNTSAFQNSREQDDFTAYGHFENGVKLGEPGCLYMLGMLCFQGRGEEYRPSYLRAKDYWEQAALKDASHYDAAVYRLGTLYEKGLGVEQSHAQALEFYLKGYANEDKPLKKSEANL
jgi:TPR repeat protein